MKTKYFFLAGFAAMLASCANEEYIGDTSPNATLEQTGDGSIQFGFNLPAITRADQTGSTAATTLGNTFYVYGIKTEKTDGAGAVGTGHTVFKNYVVKYEANTAYTTTSNTKDWEYVGKALTTKEAANITANDGTGAQTIKYWDYAAPDYTFYAFSAKSEDIEGDKVAVVKNQTVTTSKYLDGYTATLAAGADIDKLFFSERVNIAKSSDADRAAKNQYGGNVTLRFHNAAAKVRVAMYETIDGYSVTLDKFSVDNDGANPAFDEMTDDVTANFAANLTNSKGGQAGALTVTYYDVTNAETENHPILSFAQTGGANKVLTLGTNLKATTELATSITTPTYDQAGGVYTSMFPNKDNSQNLKLKLTYTLTAPGTGEKIIVKDATAEIPADYLKWKPGFAYTYIFKISANTNGNTGETTDPVGLYPITFDAVATVNEDGLAEYITTVSEPSITTFAAIFNNSDKFQAYQTHKSDYQIPGGTDKLNIYATIMDGSSVANFTFNSDAAGGVNVYKVSSSDDTNFPVNEASIAEALREIATGTKKITCEKVNTDATTNFAAAPAKVTTVPGEDGVNITINALKLSGVKTAGKYAIEYVKTPATYHTSSETLSFTDAAALATWEASNYKLYDNADGTTAAIATGADKTYYKRTSVKSVGVYTYKIVTVVAAP